MADLDEIKSVLENADRLYSTRQVEASIESLATEITRVLKDSNPLVLCVMVGGVIFTGKLTNRLAFPLEINYIHATRYDGETSGRELKWIARPSTELKDRSILVLDDILDEGHTLKAIVDDCKAAGARQVITAVLVEKRHSRKADIKADFVGLQVDDRYVFGYGMDYKNYLRNAPGIFAVKDS
ncbi:MAG: hypoxanthine-guanine phosphoribosyltransferase [Gammaproteobacteria bacterium]|nr:MAG: hypoxanthine-guanine phosphoribosyltransferase [Gammaproteobacteria bacterium]